MADAETLNGIEHAIAPSCFTGHELSRYPKGGIEAVIQVLHALTHQFESSLVKVITQTSRDSRCVQDVITRHSQTDKNDSTSWRQDIRYSSANEFLCPLSD